MAAIASFPVLTSVESYHVELSRSFFLLALRDHYGITNRFSGEHLQSRRPTE